MPGGLEPGVGVISWGESELEWGVLSCAHPTAGLGAGGVGSGEHPPTHKAGSHPLWGPQSCSSYCWGHATPCWSGWAQQGQRGPRAGSKAGRPARGARALQGQCAACQGPALRVLDAEPETSAQVLRAGQGWGGEGGGLQGTHAPRSLRRGILKAAGPWQARGVTVWVGGPKPVGLSDAPLPRACAQPSGTPVPLAPASTWAPAPARRTPSRTTAPALRPSPARTVVQVSGAAGWQGAGHRREQWLTVPPDPPPQRSALTRAATSTWSRVSAGPAYTRAAWSSASARGARSAVRGPATQVLEGAARRGGPRH